MGKKYLVQKYEYATGKIYDTWQRYDSEIVAYTEVQKLNKMYPVGSKEAGGFCYILGTKEERS